MDEFKIIFWIIIALIYLFSRRKKKQEQAPPRRQPSPAPAQTAEYEAAPPKKQLTFEELLREIEEMKQPAAPPPQNPYRPPVRKEPEYVDYDDDVKEERQTVEDTNYDYRKADKIYDVYEDAKKQAFLRPSLEETVKLQDTVVRFNQFKEYEQKDKHNFSSEVLKELKSPSGFRKAFIMSEILRRKF